MAEAGQVNTFYSKVKANLPKVEVHADEHDSSKFMCKVTLGGVMSEGHGFAEASFTDFGRTKKAAKAAAMKQAHKYLREQPIYQSNMQSDDMKVRP
jgi:hypothetical protein